MNSRRYLILCLGFVSLSLVSIHSEKRDRGLLPDAVTDILLDEVSAERAIDLVCGLAYFDRIAASREYDQAADYVLQKLHEAGVTEASIEAFPEVWSPTYYLAEKPRWLWPIGWSVKKAVLRIVEPQMKIADYDEEPIILARMSRSFCGRGELIYVGNGVTEADYAGLDVKGKLVLARGYAHTVHELAVIKKGALGVICFGTSSYNTLKGMGRPDMVIWQALPM